MSKYTIPVLSFLVVLILFLLKFSFLNYLFPSIVFAISFCLSFKDLGNKVWFWIVFFFVAIIEDLLFSYFIGTTLLCVSIVCLILNYLSILIPVQGVFKAILFPVIAFGLFSVCVNLLFLIINGSRFNFEYLLMSWYNIPMIIFLNFILNYFLSNLEREIKI